MKKLMNSETFTVSRIKFLLRITISAIRQFSPRFLTSYWTGEKSA
jgi:hypothetical protein